MSYRMSSYQFTGEDYRYFPELAKYKNNEFVKAEKVKFHFPTQMDIMKVKKSMKKDITIMGRLVAFLVGFLSLIFILSTLRGNLLTGLGTTLVFSVIIVPLFLFCNFNYNKLKNPKGIIYGCVVYKKIEIRYSRSSGTLHKEEWPYVMLWIEDQQVVVLPTLCNKVDYDQISIGDTVALVNVSGVSCHVYRIC